MFRDKNKNYSEINTQTVSYAIYKFSITAALRMRNHASKEAGHTIGDVK